MASDEATEKQYEEEAKSLYAALPSDRPMPPTEAEEAYKQITEDGVILLSGGRTVLNAADVSSVEPFITNLCAEWLMVAVRGLEPQQLCALLCMLTETASWSNQGKLVAGAPPYCDQRKTLALAVFDGMKRCGKDVPTFLRDVCASDDKFISLICNIALLPDHAPIFEFWLETSSRFGIRDSQGRVHRALHPAIFRNKMLAIEVAQSGNLAVLRLLDSDGFDVRAKFGCCGGQTAMRAAKSAGHKECVEWLKELESYPKPLTY